MLGKTIRVSDRVYEFLILKQSDLIKKKRKNISLSEVLEELLLKRKEAVA